MAAVKIIFGCACLLMAMSACSPLAPVRQQSARMAPVMDRIIQIARDSEQLWRQDRAAPPPVVAGATKETEDECLASMHVTDMPIALLLLELARLCALDLSMAQEATGRINAMHARQPARQLLADIGAVAGLHLTETAPDRWLMGAADTSRATREQLPRLVRIPLNNRRVAELEPLLRARLHAQDATLWLSADAVSNSIVAEVDASQETALRKHIAMLDRSHPLFLIEAWVLEVSEQAQTEIGLDVHVGRDLADANSAESPDAQLQWQVPTPNATLTFEHIRQDIVVRLAALQEIGATRIISNPRIYVVHGHAAEIFQGEEIPYQVTTEDGTHTEFQQAGLRLKVTPYRLHDTWVHLDLELSKDSVQTGAGQPIIARREMKTAMQLPVRAMAMISGIRIDREGQRNDSVPAAPFVGAHASSGDRAQLLVLLSARLL